jgi:hypothetical protein
LDKRVAKRLCAEKVVKALNNQTFTCEADARKAVAKASKKLKWHHLTATYHPVEKYPREVVLRKGPNDRL